MARTGTAQVTVRDRRPERPLGRPRRVDVDPLVIVVASANPLIRSCVTSSQSVGPNSLPIRSPKSVMPAPIVRRSLYTCPGTMAVVQAGSRPNRSSGDAHFSEGGGPADIAPGTRRSPPSAPAPLTRTRTEIVADPVDDPAVGHPRPPRSASSRERSGGEPSGPKLPGARRSRVGWAIRAASALQSTANSPWITSSMCSGRHRACTVPSGRTRTSAGSSARDPRPSRLRRSRAST